MKSASGAALPVQDAASLARAYAACRRIARREAKNFYYAFRVLPGARRNAMCAVYAFMRRADDLADDESLTVEARRTAMAAWLAQWRASRLEPSADPVFVALLDTQRRFAIPDALLEDLVRGTAMDLELDTGVAGGGLPMRLDDGLLGYRTFADLERYCYLVASVVGLVTIRIFGYTDPAAELLAERTGVAFQLTNILRDVKEDLERGRVYLPEEMLHEFAVSHDDLRALSAGRAMKPNERALLSAVSVEAWERYGSAHALLPMIDRGSRAALWVLVTIYSRLLARIDRRGLDVFSVRVSVPAGAKLLILLSGAAMSVRDRLARR